MCFVAAPFRQKAISLFDELGGKYPHEYLNNKSVNLKMRHIASLGLLYDAFVCFRQDSLRIDILKIFYKISRVFDFFN
jgi:hypothetical protein